MHVLHVRAGPLHAADTCCPHCVGPCSYEPQQRAAWRGGKGMALSCSPRQGEEDGRGQMLW